jgi:2-phospho-L-lactate guanylyltransferase
VTETAGDWCLVVPVKRLAAAKTRLGGAASGHRAELALAFALDTVAGALSCRPVRAVVAVTDDAAARAALTALGALVVPDGPDAGLNAAIRHGAALATRRHPDCGVGALSADLPALRPGELDAVLREAGRHRSGFVRDASTTGTTLLVARHGTDLTPRFGPSSARAHEEGGATDLTQGETDSLRRDVDTEDDLLAAVRLGVGPRTAQVLRGLGAYAPDPARPE